MSFPPTFRKSGYLNKTLRKPVQAGEGSVPPLDNRALQAASGHFNQVRSSVGLHETGDPAESEIHTRQEAGRSQTDSHFPDPACSRPTALSESLTAAQGEADLRPDREIYGKAEGVEDACPKTSIIRRIAPQQEESHAI